MRRFLAMLSVACVMVGVTVVPAAAAPPIEIVHSESVRLGDSTMAVSFSEWPLRSHRSLDFTFEPDGGIEGRTGLLRVISPSGDTDGLAAVGLERRGDDVVLPRHPRDRDVWGLDVVALPEEGRWRFEFTVEGPEGTSTATLPLEVGPPPGPPHAVSWTVGMVPWIPVVLLLGLGWFRTRLIRRSEVHAWSG